MQCFHEVHKMNTLLTRHSTHIEIVYWGAYTKCLLNLILVHPAVFGLKTFSVFLKIAHFTKSWYDLIFASPHLF